MALNPIILLLLISLLGVIFSIIGRNSPKLCHQLNAITALVALYIVYFYPASSIPPLELLELIPGFKVSFYATTDCWYFCRYVSILWLFMVCYCYGYHQYHHIKHPARLLGYTALAIWSTFAIALADNLLTMYIAYEMLTLMTYPLVTIKNTDSSKKAGKTYLLYLLGTSLGFMLPAIVVCYYYSVPGSNLHSSGIFADGTPANAIGIALLLMLLGTAKAGLWPFCKWLPAAMVAPIPVSGLLHAVAVVKSGIIVLYKFVIYAIGATTWEALVGDNFLVTYIWIIPSITIIYAGLRATFVDDLKQILAYSTINQLALIVLSIVTIPLSPSLILLYIASHGLAKITLFFATGGLHLPNQKYILHDMRGRGFKQLSLGICFFIASLSMAGLPITLGFASKFLLLQEMFNTLNWPGSIMMIVGSVLTIFYLTRANLALFTPVPNLIKLRIPPLLRYSVVLATFVLLAAVYKVNTLLTELGNYNG